MASLQSILIATFVEAMLESALYGLYSFLFFTVVYLFWVKPAPKRGPRAYLFVAIVLQYLISTAHWICTIFYICQYFIIHGGGLAAAVAFARGGAHGDPLVVLYTLSSFAATAFAIHRVSMVLQNKPIATIFPCLLMVLYAVTTATGITLTSQRGTPVAFPWVLTSSMLELVVSAYSTALIAWKIWRVNSDAEAIRVDTGRAQKSLTSLIAIITESYGIQTTIDICILISYVTGSLIGKIVFSGLAPPIFGIANLLIHARIALGWAREPKPERKTEASTVVFRTNATTSVFGSEREDVELQQQGQEMKPKGGQGV
ncbi:Arginine biosynthesis bifunctional protein ArgJ, mitochondrial [Mycena venus]|uniref:Arginine biosynthesis bifunctional protein ArgJ, mitochondrial n=1 Tax=Mycena venus TaxID=2733690 RepID=A0A8H6YBW8_9AGAR|nr:Arginine biosynthesis bifunctional protein ArgJ, mitochondrial [Mycena venus]